MLPPGEAGDRYTRRVQQCAQWWWVWRNGGRNPPRRHAGL